MRQLYFDHNATTPVAASVREAMTPFFGECFGDPASGHSLGRAAYEAVEDARGQLAMLLGCDAEELVFTSGGTESNNLAIQGLALTGGRSAGGHIIISSVEHPSVTLAARFMERLGFDVTVLPVTGQGTVQPAALKQVMRSDTILVSVMLANHETGVIQPVKQLAEICHAGGVALHTDAAQAVGKVRTQVDELGIDLMTVSGHKMYGPKGAGALFIRQGMVVEPILHGGGQEGGMRGGTPNVAGIVGLGAAAALAFKGLEAAEQRLEKLRDRLLAAIRREVGHELVVHGELAARLPNTLAVSFPGVSGYALLARVPELCAWANSSGPSNARAISEILGAMGVSPEVARGTIRLSLGWYTTADDVERAASLLLAAWEAERK